MSTAKKSKPKAKPASKAVTKKASTAGKKPSEAILLFAAVCITFLLLVDTYYVCILVQAHS